MKSEAQLIDRIKVLLVAEWERRVLVRGTRTPEACRNHHWQDLNLRNTADGTPNDAYNRVAVEGGTRTGLCLYGSRTEEWSGTLCEDAVDAQRCPHFDPLWSPGLMYADYLLDLADLEWVSSSLAEVQILSWALETLPAPPAPSWVRRVLTWLGTLVGKKRALTTPPSYTEAFSLQECLACLTLPGLADAKSQRPE